MNKNTKSDYVKVSHQNIGLDLKNYTSNPTYYSESAECYGNDGSSSQQSFTLPLGISSDYSQYNSDTPRTQSSETSQVSTVTSQISANNRSYNNSQISANSESYNNSQTSANYRSYNNSETSANNQSYNNNNYYANMSKCSSPAKGGQKRGVATVGPIVQMEKSPGRQTYDSSDYILDKIDYEFYNMARSQALQQQSSPHKGTPLKKKKKKPGRKDRAVLKSQGVEFDTGDETSGVELRHVLVLNDGYKQTFQGMSLDLSADGNDTGVGTASLAEGSDLDNLEPKQILGKVDVYSEAEEKNHVYLTSDVAKQIDAQYKQILKKKSGEFIQNLAQKSSLSDLSSVLTEDLVTKYKQYMVKSISECSFPTKSGRPLVLNQASLHHHPVNPYQKGRDVAMSDLDSIKTEDIEGEFRKAMVRPPLSDISQASKLKSQKLKNKSKAAKATKIPKFTANPLKTKKKRGHRGFGMSDVESVRTEDFENSFNKMMVKQIGGVPITSFDQMMVDSDLDTIKSHVIREKLRAALAANNPEDEENNDSEEYFSDESDKFDTVIDTHKLQELLKNTSHSVHNISADHRVSLESVEAMQGSPRKEYSFSQDHQTSNYRSTPDHSASNYRSTPDHLASNYRSTPERQTHYSFQKVQSSIPPPLWEKDETSYNNWNESLTETRNESTTSPSSELIYHRRLSGANVSKVPLAQTKLRKILATMNSDSSLSTDAAVSDAASSSQESKNDSVDRKGMVEQPKGKMARRNSNKSSEWNRNRQTSSQSYTSTSKSESSNFEEVESIDFDMQHDINLADLTRALKGLSEKEKGEMSSSSSRSGYLRRKKSERNFFGIEAKYNQGNAEPGKPFNVDNKKRRSRVLIEDSDEEDDVNLFSLSKQTKKKHLGKLEKRESSGDILVNTPEWVLKNVFQRLSTAKRMASQVSTESNLSSSWSTRSSFSSSRGSFSMNPYPSFVIDGEEGLECEDENGTDEPENMYEEDGKSMCLGVPNGMHNGHSSLPNGVHNGFSSLSVDTGHQMYRPVPQAEDMLMNLGFGGIGSFLPERFAKDWYNKIAQAKREFSHIQHDYVAIVNNVPMQERVDYQPDQVRKVSNMSVQEGDSSGIAFHDAKTLVKSLSSENKIKRHTSNFLRKIDLNSRTNANHRRQRWRRAVSAISCGSAIAESLNLLQNNRSQENSMDSTTDNTSMSNDEPDIQKQDSLDQLKSVLERQAHILHLGSKKGEKRRQQFVSNRQQSLPLFLETLSEEDEGRLSRGPSLDKLRQPCIGLSINRCSSGEDELNETKIGEKIGIDPSRKLNFRSRSEERVSNDKLTDRKLTDQKSNNILKKSVSEEMAWEVKLAEQSRNTTHGSLNSISNEFLVNDSDGLNSSYASSFSEKSITTDSAMFKSASVGSSLSLLSDHNCSESSHSPVNRSTSMTSSFDLEIECPTDTENDSISGEINGRRKRGSSPLLNDTISLGQTGFCIGRELIPSPMSPRWYNSDMEDNADEMGDKSSPWSTSPANVPDITVTRTSSPGKLCSQSSASLEIEEIMASDSEINRNNSQINGSKTENRHLQLVPAMVSVVLSDVDDKQSVINTYNENGLLVVRHRPLSATFSDSDDHLRAPSPSLSTLSCSPVPLSPITVIEMDHLDNQNDSMDSGDASSGDHNYKIAGREDSGSNLLQNTLCVDLLQPISEASDEGAMSTDISRDPSFEETVNYGVNYDNKSNTKIANIGIEIENADIGIEVENSDVGIEVDDGSLSPIYMLRSDITDEAESAYSSALTSAPSSDGPHSRPLSNSKSAKQSLDLEDKAINSHLMEESVQTEVQCLSPIVFQHSSDMTNQIPMDYYIVCDRNIQCGNSFSVCSLDKPTQTEQGFGDERVATDPKMTDNKNVSTTYNFSRSISDFEPQLTIGSQTETSCFPSNISKQTSSKCYSFASDAKHLKDLLCSKCVGVFNEFNECVDNKGQNHDNKLFSEEEMYKVTNHHGYIAPGNNHQGTNLLNECNSNLFEPMDESNSENSSSDINIEEQRILEQNSSPSTQQKTKFSPTLFVQKMLDRSIKMANYIEKNISLSDSYTEDLEPFQKHLNVESDQTNETLSNTVSDSNINMDETFLKQGYDEVSPSENKGNVQYESEQYVNRETETTINKVEMTINKVVDIGVFVNRAPAKSLGDNFTISDVASSIGSSNFLTVPQIDTSCKDSLNIIHGGKVCSPNIDEFDQQNENYGECNGKSNASSHLPYPDYRFLTSLKADKRYDEEQFCKSPVNSIDLQNLEPSSYNSKLNLSRTPFNSIDIQNMMENDISVEPSALSMYENVGLLLNSVTTETDGGLADKFNVEMTDVNTSKTDSQDMEPEKGMERNDVKELSSTLNAKLESFEIQNKTSRRLSKNYKLGRNLKTFEKVDSWLEKSLSCSSESTSCALESKINPSKIGSPVQKQLQWEKNVLKAMTNQSQRWMDYFDTMDRDRLKLVPTHPFQLDIDPQSANNVANCLGEAVKTDLTSDRAPLQNIDNITSNRKSDNSEMYYSCSDNGKNFDLNNLLTRIDRIENLIKTVTTTYNKSSMNFDEVSRQISEDSENLNCLEVVNCGHKLKENSRIPGKVKSKKMTPHKTKMKVKERLYAEKSCDNVICQNHIQIPNNSITLSEAMDLSSNSLHVKQEIDQPLNTDGLSIGYKDFQEDTTRQVPSDLQDTNMLNTLHNVERPSLTPANTIDRYEESSKFQQPQDITYEYSYNNHVPSAFKVVNKGKATTYPYIKDNDAETNLLLALRLQEIENEIVRSNELEIIKNNTDPHELPFNLKFNRTYSPEVLSSHDISPKMDAKFWFHPIPDQNKLSTQLGKSGDMSSSNENRMKVPVTQLLFSSTTASRSTSLSPFMGSDDDYDLDFGTKVTEEMNIPTGSNIRTCVNNQQQIQKLTVDSILSHTTNKFRLNDEKFLNEKNDQTVPENSDWNESSLTVDRSGSYETADKEEVMDITEFSSVIDINEQETIFKKISEKICREVFENVAHDEQDKEDNTLCETIPENETIPKPDIINVNMISHKSNTVDDSYLSDTHNYSNNLNCGDLVMNNLAGADITLEGFNRSTDINISLTDQSLCEKIHEDQYTKNSMDHNDISNMLEDEFDQEECRSSPLDRFLETNSLCGFDTSISEEYYDRYCMEHRDSLSKLSFSAKDDQALKSRCEYGTKQKAYSIDYGSMTAKERRLSFGRSNEAFDC